MIKIFHTTKTNKNQPEFILQKQVCAYLNAQYKNVLYVPDVVANGKLTPAQQGRLKSIRHPDFKVPDLLILHPNTQFKGLFIELKVETPFKKDGLIKASQNDHLLKQQQSIDRLNLLGYYACFGIGFHDTIKKIDTYLKII